MCRYQLCTKDGATLWHADQADNIDKKQLRQLAHGWLESRAEKLENIVWPKAAHMVDWLLQENPLHRPHSWDQVMQHPLFASMVGPATIKRVVMSCPEMGTLDKDGGAPYDQNVMEMVSQLQQIGYVKFGFDRAGTSTGREKDGEKFDSAFALWAKGKHDEAIRLLKSTDWWYGYQTSVKQAVKLECQGFDGILDITCIKGGPITQLEAAEMPQIMADAQRDCEKSGIAVRYTITELSYSDFLRDYGFLQLTDCADGRERRRHKALEVSSEQSQQLKMEPEPELELEPESDANESDANGGTVQAVDEQLDRDKHGSTSVAIKPSEIVEVDAHECDVHAQLVEAREQLAAKDKELAKVTAAKEELAKELASVVAAKDEEIASVVAAKDEEIVAKDEEIVAKDEEICQIASVVAAKDAELQQLRAQLARLEGVPPQRD